MRGYRLQIERELVSLYFSDYDEEESSFLRSQKLKKLLLHASTRPQKAKEACDSKMLLKFLVFTSHVIKTKNRTIQ